MGVYKPDIYDLGIMLQNIKNFSMTTFDDRLILQKTIYILKSFGIDLGYNFHWHKRGVYSVQLTRDGFDLIQIMDKIPQFDIKYKSEKTQSQFKKFMEFMKNRKSNVKELELASSICFWGRGESTKEDTLQTIAMTKPQFTKEEGEKMWDELQKCDGILK